MCMFGGGGGGGEKDGEDAKVCVLMQVCSHFVLHNGVCWGGGGGGAEG